MKLLIASDIHGSAHYCRRLMEAYEREGAERMLLLGDLLYHGPRNDLPEGYAPKEVIPMLNGIKDEIIAVRGNCEAEVDQMVLDFPVMADYTVIPLGERIIYAAHGHHASPAALPPLKAGDIFISGHTHIPMCREVEGIVCLNPGSVSIPKEGSDHGYILLDGETFYFKTLDGGIYDTYEAGTHPQA